MNVVAWKRDGIAPGCRLVVPLDPDCQWRPTMAIEVHRRCPPSLPFLMMGLLACDPVGSAIIDVVLPVELQASLTDAYPIHVLVREADRPCVRVVGVLCDPSDAEVAFQWEDVSVCPGPEEVRFWAASLSPTPGVEIDCEPQPASRLCVDVDGVSVPLTEEAVKPIFQRGDCNEGDERHRVELRLRE